MYEDEIDLRALYQTLVDGRWLVAGFIALAVLLAAIFSFFVTAPTYQADARVMATPPPSFGEVFPAGRNETGTGQSLSLGDVVPAAIPADTLAVLAKSPRLLSRAAASAGMPDNADLTGAVDAAVADDKATVIVTARATSPELAAALANSVAGELAIKSSALNADDLDRQIADRLKLAQGRLAALRSQAATVPETLVTRQSLAEDPAWTAVIAQRLGITASQAAGLTITREEINPTWQRLQDLMADLQSEIAGLNVQEQALHEGRAADAAAAAAFRKAVGGGPDAAAALNLKLASAIITSPAIAPRAPSSPHKMLNMAVAAVLGAMLGVFAVFFRQFLRRPAPAAGMAASRS